MLSFNERENEDNMETSFKLSDKYHKGKLFMLNLP